MTVQVPLHLHSKQETNLTNNLRNPSISAATHSMATRGDAVTE